MYTSMASFLVQAKQGKFLKVTQSNGDLAKPFNSLSKLEDREDRVRLLVSVVELMEDEWGLSMPPMILSITGNAAPFEMRPAFEKTFSQALLKATQATGAWLISGGTASSVQ